MHNRLRNPVGHLDLEAFRSQFHVCHPGSDDLLPLGRASLGEDLLGLTPIGERCLLVDLWRLICGHGGAKELLSFLRQGFEPGGSDPMAPEAVRLVDCRPGEGSDGTRPRALSDWCSAEEALAWLAGYQAGQERAGTTEGTRTKRNSLR